MKRTVIIIALLSILISAGAALAAGTPSLSRYVIAGGGGKASAGDYTLKATLGQPITGRSSGGASDLCVGFWCGLARYKVFLPLVMRE